MSELVQAYGTKEAPLSIEQARAKIRSDFTRFAQMVINGVTLPAGHVFAQSPALGIDHQLTWYLGCEIESANAGLSVFGHLAVADDKDSNQLHIEARYFHPELHFRDENGKAKSSRNYNPGFGAHLWVDQVWAECPSTEPTRRPRSVVGFFIGAMGIEHGPTSPQESAPLQSAILLRQSWPCANSSFTNPDGHLSALAGLVSIFFSWRWIWRIKVVQSTRLRRPSWPASTPPATGFTCLALVLLKPAAAS